MNTGEPTTQSWVNEPGAKKRNTWIWILVIVAVVCLCMVLAALVVGLYVFNTADKPEPVRTAIDDHPLPPTKRAAPTDRAAPTEEAIPTLPRILVIEPYDPASDEFAVGLTDLVPDWSGSMLPGAQVWDATVWSNQKVIVNQGWCTTTAAILDQNFDHIQIRWEVDGEFVDMEGMYFYEELYEDRVCRGYAGIIMAWPLGTHSIVTGMTFDEPLNDGWDDFPAGEYIDQYIIEVMR